MDVTLIIIVFVALLFDFTNGFHDTANAIATVVTTKAVPPKLAVIGAAVLNFLGAFVSLKVAATIANGIVDSKAITLHIILAGLAGAIIWNFITWRSGLPTSSSHALIGGIGGAAVMSVGWSVIKWHGLQDKVLIPSLIAPFLGLIGAAVLMIVLTRFIKNTSARKNTKVFKRLQIVSGGFVAFTHGTNDAQKTMGVIALALVASHADKTFHVPIWVIVSSAAAMALGTYFGGWRIINTLGKKVTVLEPKQGFTAETSTAATLSIAAHFGFPVSTTHTISGSILGAGAVSNPKTVNWRVVRQIIAAWLVTIPCAALVGALIELLTRLPAGSGIVAVVTILIIGVIYITRNWAWESRAQIRNRLVLLSPFKKLS